MLSISHAATGALITTKIPYPIISVPLTLAAHYAQDYIPHWDVGQGLTKGKKSKTDAFFQELLTDFPLSIAFVYFVFQHNRPFSIWPWLGWFVALLPDFLEFPYIFLNWRFWPIKPLAKFHSRFHNSIPDKVKGLIPQILIVIAVYFLA